MSLSVLARKDVEDDPDQLMHLQQAQPTSMNRIQIVVWPGLTVQVCLAYILHNLRCETKDQSRATKCSTGIDDLIMIDLIMILSASVDAKLEGGQGPLSQ